MNLSCNPKSDGSVSCKTFKEITEDSEPEEDNEEDIKGKIVNEEFYPREMAEKTSGIEKIFHSSQLNVRRGSMFGKVGLSTHSPSRSLSFNTTRDKVRVHDLKNTPPKSPTLSLRRPKSPLSHPNSPLSGSSLNRRSFGPPDSKLVVLGVPCVGKSAVVVRLMTGRFIWEYDPTLEAVYRYHTIVDEDPASMEILDTAGIEDGRVNEGHVRWGDGFLIIYSSTDRNSFLAVHDIHAAIASLKHTPNFPCVVLANKSDLVHLSKVCEAEASNQASELGVSFFSGSACEGSPSLWEAFSELHRDVVRRARSRRRRSSAKVVIEGFYKMFTR